MDGKCEHGHRPWWDCEECRRTQQLGVNTRAEIGALISKEPLVLGDTLSYPKRKTRP